MAALSIVEHFDVLEDIGSRSLTRTVNDFADALLL